MSFENPTRLRLDMRANLGGRNYQVVGRTVMGEEEDGKTYYWNEFNLEDASGLEATLVYEETEYGAKWRLFTLVEPENPITAAEAAAKQVGDWLNLTGTSLMVTFQGSSKIYQIEGQAAEGEKLGDVAKYFNAEAGGALLVVSWTGDEVEVYNGLNLAPGVIATAFNLPLEPGRAAKIFSALNDSPSPQYNSGQKFMLQIGILAAVFLLVLLVAGRGCSTSYEAAPVVKISPGGPPLAAGETGTLFEKHYRVATHAVVEIAKVGACWEEHEYELADDYGFKSLLVCGRLGSQEWIHYEPFISPAAPTAKQAGATPAGGTVNLDGETFRVNELFLTTVESADGEASDGLKKGAITYGYGGAGQNSRLLARWNDAGVQFFRGQVIPVQKGTNAFTAAK